MEIILIADVIPGGNDETDHATSLYPVRLRGRRRARAAVAGPWRNGQHAHEIPRAVAATRSGNRRRNAERIEHVCIHAATNLSPASSRIAADSVLGVRRLHGTLRSSRLFRDSDCGSKRHTAAREL